MKFNVKDFLRKYTMVIALVVVFILFCGLTDGRLLYAQNMSNLMLQNGYVLVLACGMQLDSFPNKGSATILAAE